MRAQALLRAAGALRLPGAAAPETFQAIRSFSSSVLAKDGVFALSGSKEERTVASSCQFGRQTPFASFASQGLHTLVTREEEKGQASPALSVAAMEAPKAPLALTALPPKPAMTRRMGSAAAHEPHYHDHSKIHPFHVLPTSKWPALSCYGTLLTMLGMAGWFHSVPHTGAMMMLGFTSTLVTALSWWRDCLIESDMGCHSEVVKQNLMSGVWWFIASEAVLFFGLLWSCVHLGMSPNVHVQMQWPPVGIEAIGWEGRAMVMSAVLAASYFSANVAMVSKDPKVVMGALGTTIGLGALFLADQYLEYSSAPFTITDGPYASTFFMTTGFHGFHVLLGTLWLIAAAGNYAKTKQTGVAVKGAVLYWHFVDIVWIAVYGIIYAAQL